MSNETKLNKHQKLVVNDLFNVIREIYMDADLRTASLEDLMIARRNLLDLLGYELGDEMKQKFKQEEQDNDKAIL